MSVRYIPGPVIDQPNVVLRGCVLYSVPARTTSIANYHTVEVGIQQGEFTTWVGEWDQSTQKIEAGESLRILADSRHEMRLPQGVALVVRVTQVGALVSIDTAKVDVTLGLVGGRAGDKRPLVSVGQGIIDANARAAVSALSRQINGGGLSEWTVSIQLFDPDGTADEAAFAVTDDYDSATQTTTAGAAYATGPVTVTLTKPSWATTGYVHAAAQADVSGATTGVAYMTIYDGTTDHNEMAVSTITGDGRQVTTSAAFEITATTTIVTRIKSTTVNVLYGRSTLAVSVAWA